MLVVINGPAGVGKSTVAGLVANRLPRSVHVSGDSLRSFAPPAARAFLRPGSTCRAAACLASSYLEMGAAVVVFDYVSERPRHVEHLRAALPAETALHLVTLWAPQDVLDRRARRRGDALVRTGRRSTSYDRMAEHLPGLGWVLDTTGRAARVADAVVDRLLVGGFPVASASSRDAG